MPQSGAAPARAARAPLAGRVLVVDDEHAVAQMMRELLESWGLAATAVSRPQSVMAMLAREPGAYDLVILDQTMPGITGLSLARELHAAWPSLPVLLYSGNSERIDPDQLAAAGVRALFRKPVEPGDLYELLRRYLP